MGKDGTTAECFRSKCEKASATLSIIETATGVIIGGYSDQSWERNESFKPSEKSFLFVLSDGSESTAAPYKMKLKGGSSPYAIYTESSGPSFGGGCDLQVFKNLNKLR